MKVGDYVRTKDYQNIRSRIGKIIKQDGKYYYLDIDEDTQIVWEEDTILKPSPDIIDILQVGDYVNGMKVKEINNVAGFVIVNTSSISENTIFSYNIKSIVTREQFEAMEYKLED